MDIDEVVQQLTGKPFSLGQAKARDGVPHEPGFYAWWSIGHPIPGVPAPPHPTEDGVFLFYVGISPSNERSSQDLRKRVVGSHLRGNTGGSTFRQTLASLLFEELSWEPIMRDRALLTKEANDQLSQWQRENLRVRWAVRPRPWEIEDQVIERLKPPLNLAMNSGHDFYPTLSAARRRFKEAAALRPQDYKTRPRKTTTTSNPPPVKGTSMAKTTLHEEIADILRERGGGWMTTQAIADQVALRARYLKGNGTSDVSAFQVHGRTRQYPDLFERQGSRVRLREP